MAAKDLHRVISEYDRDHPPRDPVDRRRAELAAAREAEERAKREQQAREAQQLAQQKQVSDSWVQWTEQRIEQRIEQHIAKWIGRDGQRGALLDAMGTVIGQERESRRKEIKAAIAETQREVGAKLEAVEQRISFALETLNERIKHATELGQMVSRQSSEQRKDVGASIEVAQQEIKEIKCAFESKLVVLEQRIVQHANQHADERIIHDIKQCSERINALSHTIATECADRKKEVQAAVAEARRGRDAAHGAGRAHHSAFGAAHYSTCRTLFGTHPRF